LMSQHDYIISNDTGANVRSDLNNALGAIATVNSGATEPSTTYAYQLWMDTANNVLKMRNSANSAWYTLPISPVANNTVDINGGTVDGITSLSVSGTSSLNGAVVINESGADVDFRIESDTNANAFFLDGATGNVGVGTSSPSASGGLTINKTTTGQGFIDFKNSVDGDSGIIGNAKALITGATTSQLGIRGGTNGIAFSVAATERMRIDSSGNLLVGKTALSSSTAGFQVESDGAAVITRSGNFPLILNRSTSNGGILQFRKDNTTVGTIGTGPGGGDFFKVIGAKNYFDAGVGNTGLRFYEGVRRIYPINTDTDTEADNAIDLGAPTSRFDDIYATNGTIQTSDRNEKQDIEELSEAETRAAIAAKGLLKKFRWKDAVAEKGDEARIHFGIIAQELQAAFEAEGLDAGRYAMFIHSTWWETYTDVPAVEAVDAVYETQTDEEANEVQVLVSEAVEAKEAYTRTDTYASAEEAPEGAVEKSRMGVRYSELLAFIIAAM
jgi:hypothetical protein